MDDFISVVSTDTALLERYEPAPGSLVQVHVRLNVCDSAGNHAELRGQLDSGASLDCISKAQALALGFKPFMRRFRDKDLASVKLGNGTILNVEHIVERQWSFQGKRASYMSLFYVVDGLA